MALSGKRQEIDSLRSEADDLSKVSHWPADLDCLTAQLTGLDDQCTSLDIKVGCNIPCTVCKNCVYVSYSYCVSWQFVHLHRLLLAEINEL